MSENLKSEQQVTKRKNTKKVEYDLPIRRGKKLDLPALPRTQSTSPVNSRKLTVVDLFCGAGGMSLGFEDMGFEVMLGVDNDTWACKTFEANIPAKAVKIDLETIESDKALMTFFKEHGVDAVTGIIGGPPCQGFSRVGRGRIRHQEQLNGDTARKEDKRNTLYRRFLASVRVLKPAFFVMENVPDLDSYLDEDRKSKLIDRIEREFSELNYVVSRLILNADDFGIPQARSRLFVIGLSTELASEVRWPDHVESRKLYGFQTLRTAIGDLPLIADGYTEVSTPYMPLSNPSWLMRWYRQGLREELQATILDHVTRPHREDDKQYFKMLLEGQKYTDLPEECRRYRSDIFKDKYHKLLWDEPSWTITAHIKRDGYRYIHPQMDPPRTLSVRETARIQSFPDRWRFCGYRSNAFNQIGNAVPPLLSRAIARQIKAQVTGQAIEPDYLIATETKSTQIE